MTKNYWVISDPHLGHESSLKWLNDDGSKVRDFTTIEDLHNMFIANWIEVVQPQDYIYVLGDLVMKCKYLDLFKQLPGHKKIVFGNHDIFNYKNYMDVGFKDLYGVKVFADLKLILTHVPIHPTCVKDGWINVHGHLHNGAIKNEDGTLDIRYKNVCVEALNYKPLNLTTLRE
jgi:calcineurin-like phosphoesterase family protein